MRSNRRPFRASLRGAAAALLLGCALTACGDDAARRAGGDSLATTPLGGAAAPPDSTTPVAPFAVDSTLAEAFVGVVCPANEPDQEQAQERLAGVMANLGHAPIAPESVTELDETRDRALLVELRRALNALPEGADAEFVGLPMQLLSAIRLRDDSLQLAIVAARRAIAREADPRAESVLLLARVNATAPGSVRPWQTASEHWVREGGPEEDFESFTLDGAYRLADGRLALLVAGHDIVLLVRDDGGRWSAAWRRPLPEDCAG